MRLTSAEIDRAFFLPESAKNALNSHSSNEPGWLVSTREGAPKLGQSMPQFQGGAVWLPVAAESIALAAIKEHHGNRLQPAEWSASIDLCSLPMFTATGVNCGTRWVVGGTQANVRIRGEGETSRLAALNFLDAYLRGREA